MKITKEMLDAPAFGADALPADTSENAIADAPLAENGEKEPLTSPGEGDVSEQKVPYSRFETVSRRAREAEEAAEDAQRKYDELLSHREASREDTTQHEPESYRGSLPVYWVKMYGDNDVSREAYAYELERQSSIREEARREALEAVREERTTEGKVLSQNERIIDDRLDSLSNYLGRSVTEREEAALLDIVDEYTPKDDEGNYAGDLIGFDKAWDIYQMSQGASASRTRQARSGAVMATGSRSSGEPTGQAKDNSDFNPRDWNAYKKRI